MHLFHSQKNLPPRNKFSYATAQEYCELVKRSIDRHSHSREMGPRVCTVVSPLKNMPRLPRQQPKQLRHVRLRSKIGERSRSKSNQDSTELSSSDNRCQITSSDLRGSSRISRAPLSIKRQVSTYQQQHLLFSIQKENKGLQQQISSAELKIKRIEESIEEQRKTFGIQKTLYQQQINKLRDTLQMQITAKSAPQKETEKESEDCSFGERLKLDFTSSENEFLPPHCGFE